MIQLLSCVWLLQSHGLQYTRIPCPSLFPGVCWTSCALNQWCHPTISSSIAPFSSCPQSFLASGSFPISRLFVPDGQSFGTSVSASVLPMNIQGWFPLGLTVVMSLQSKGLSRVFSSTGVRKHKSIKVTSLIRGFCSLCSVADLTFLWAL